MQINIPLNILIRHLPTYDDQRDLLSSYNVDSPILPVESERIQKISNTLDSISEITDRGIVFYVSPVNRATETAIMINDKLKNSYNIVQDKRLYNINQGSISGMTQNEFKKEPLWRIWHDRPHHTTFPNGESLIDVYHKIQSIVSEFSRQPNINVYISHTTPLQVLATIFMNIDVSQIWNFYFEHYAMTIFFNQVLLYSNVEFSSLSGLRKLVKDYA